MEVHGRGAAYFDNAGISQVSSLVGAIGETTRNLRIVISRSPTEKSAIYALSCRQRVSCGVVALVVLVYETANSVIPGQLDSISSTAPCTGSTESQDHRHGTICCRAVARCRVR